MVPAGQEEGCVTDKGLKMPDPLQEKGHWDPWAPGQAAAAGILVRLSEGDKHWSPPKEGCPQRQKQFLLCPC